MSVFGNKDQIKVKRNNLEVELEKLLEEEKQTMVQKEQEIKESSEALKQQMLHKIRQKKAELFSLKKDNFGEEVEIVIQQNYHYTNQLDYQTKHFEYLLVQNEKLKIQLENMVNDYDIHRNIQKELARRIFLSSQIIDELNLKNEQLSTKKQDLQAKINGILESEKNRNKYCNPDKEQVSFDQYEALVNAVQKETSAKSQLLDINRELKTQFFKFFNLTQFCVVLVESTRRRVHNDTSMNSSNKSGKAKLLMVKRDIRQSDINKELPK